MLKDNFEEKIIKQAEKLKELLESRKNILILCHQYPDGDAVGSAFALSVVLSEFGKNTKIMCDDAFPKKYSYITDKVKQSDFQQADFIISVDVGDTRLLGESLKCYADKIDVSIDHHERKEGFAKYNIIYPRASATCELLYYLIIALGVEISPLIANCLYTGLSTDTGCFRYSNVTQRTYITAANLLDKGADTAKINKLMFETKALSRIKLEQLVLSSLTLYFNGKCATVALLDSMLEEVGLKGDDVEGIASIPSRVEGVLIGITFRQKEKGFKISVRTQGEISAKDICAEFGGGGHKNASGCYISGELDQIMPKVIAVAEKFLPRS